MLHRLETLLGCAVHAEGDEVVGEVDDVFFDDRDWKVRYVVVDAGGWFGERLVVLPPETVASIDWSDEILHTTLPRKAIEGAPEIPSGDPFLRQMDDRVPRYYGWPQYWTGPHVVRGLALPSTGPKSQAPSDMKIRRAVDRIPDEMRAREARLRSLQRVRGYQINAIDGRIGEVADLVADDDSWEVAYAIVDTRSLLPGGRRVLIARDHIRRVSFPDAELHVDLTTEAIERGPSLEEDAPIEKQTEVRVREAHG